MRRVSAFWMTRARSCGKVKVASESDALLPMLTSPAYHSSELDWKLDRCRNGYSALSPTHAGGAEGADQQVGPQRCPRHCADDAGGFYRPVHVKTLRSQKLRMQ